MLNITDPATIILIFIAFFLLVLIVIGIVLLATRKRDKKVSRVDYEKYADVGTDIIPGVYTGKGANDGGRVQVNIGGGDPTPSHGKKAPAAHQPLPQEVDGTVDLSSFQSGSAPSGIRPANERRGMHGAPPPMAGAARNPARVVLSFKHNGMDQFFEMTGNDLVIGREEGCGLQIVTDGYLSRRHARLFWDKGSLYIESLSAKNATSVDGRPVVQPVRISGDCTLALAATSISLRLTPPGRS